MKVYITLGSVIVVMFLSLILLNGEYKKVKKDRDTYKQNTTILLGDVERYKTSDSLNVVSIGNLELKIKEYEKYRADDYKIIEGLKVDKKRLKQITATQTEIIYQLQAMVRDSIVYVDREKLIIDTLRCITINDKWFDLSGCTSRKNEFSGYFVNRDSLLYVEHIIPKRFLGFLWKYGVKERKQEIVSRNPHTVIAGSEFITVRK